MSIKTIALIIVLLLAGSALVSAEVDDRTQSGEAAPAGDSGTFLSGASLVDVDAGSQISNSHISNSFVPSNGGIFAGGCGNNKIWILDPDCSKRGLDLSLPFGRWAVLEIVPDISGYAMLFHRLPSGDLQTEYMGYVYSGHRYRLSLSADSIGTHEIWYRIAWQESNRVTLDVGKEKRPY